MQVALQGTATAAVKEIPVPPPMESDIDYDALHARRFQQPVNYIRFSQTVEECVGCQYDMTEEDDEFLKAYNKKRPANGQLSEDDFEQIMEVFEDTASVATPYASVDKTIVPYSHMVGGLNELQLPKAMNHSREIYEYWKQRRSDVSGTLHPMLKFETHQETDEIDPFVCFRRREVRQTRKTRARDIQSADKLKKLRRELEDGRQLVTMSYEREVTKRELLLTDRAVYEQRAKLKLTKIRLGIRTDDEDLVHQKVRKSCAVYICSLSDTIRRTNFADHLLQPQKKKAPDMSVVPRNIASNQVRASVRQENRQPEMDLVQLVESLIERENELRADVIKRIENHRRWNENHVDLTSEPLQPLKDHSEGAGFRLATTQYPMTPPASDTSQEDEPMAMELDETEFSPVFHFQGALPQSDKSPVPDHRFRRRIGRLNRLWIDRRKTIASPPSEPAIQDARYPTNMDVDAVTDRWKYDQDDSEDEPEMYEIDPYSIRALKFRASLPITLPYPLRRLDGQASVAQKQPNGIAQQARQAIQQHPHAAQPAATAAPASSSAA